jgi:hypothetical protein
MDSHMLKSQNPDKEYPSNVGMKLFEHEETSLLEDFSKNIDIEKIAQNHNITVGAINSTRRKIGHKWHVKKISDEEKKISDEKKKIYKQEIIEKTKLYEKTIKQAMDKIKYYNSKILTDTKKKDTKKKKPILLESEITEFKNAMKELTTTLKEAAEMKIG